MRHLPIRSLFLSILTACIGVLSPIVSAQSPNRVAPAAPASQAPVPSQPASLCANRPLCYDANDFVATVTEFRTSTAGNGAKVLDAMVHFVNKTNQAISLGYVDGSGAAIDDMGNRFVLNTWGGGVRGMGVVSGNNMDPKFTLPAGGGADARFELWWAPYGKLAGVNYEMEFSLREMNRVEGNQWTLGDESLIHYQGLANGMGVAPITGGNSFAAGSSGMGAPSGSGAIPSIGSAVNTYVPGAQANNSGQVAPTSYVAAGQPCPPGTSPSPSRVSGVANAVGQQNQNANNAISNASSAISSLGSLFKKKSQPQNTPGAIPCLATTTANPMVTPAAATSGNPAANAVTSRTARTPATPAQPATTSSNAKAATARPLSRPVTNASLKQPATNPAKPSPAKPANTKSASGTAPSNTQSH